MVKAVFEFRGFATCHIVHCATRNEPHDQLNALTASFAHVVDVRNVSGGLRVVDELVQERIVKRFVDQACARTLKLMAHATRSPDVNVDVLVVAFNRFANGFTQIEAAAALFNE